ncbi:MAG: TIGR03936 family radical SAM-associated protein [Anaerolineae bacterium]
MIENRQRLLLTFAKGEEVKYISHLDLVRLWERALRRAGVPLAYSQGFNPQPRITVAAPLPVGFTGRAELIDVLLAGPVDLPDFARKVQGTLPGGVELLAVEEIPLKAPALPALVRRAEYRASVEAEERAEEMTERVAGLLAAEQLFRQRKKRGQMRKYDLRPLIEELWVEGCAGGQCVFGMLLHAESQATGRPDEVLAALGLEGRQWAIERVRLFFSVQPCL